MAKIKVLNENFKSGSQYDAPIELTEKDIHVPSVHQVVKASLAGRRQGTACTKNRSLVSGGGAKPFKQKGTGRARQGSSRSPLLVGGGTAFGPTPRDYTQKVNKKMAVKAIRSVLADKIKEGKLTVIETLQSDGKTKDMFQKLSSNNLLPALVVTEKRDSLALKATRNIARAKAMAVEGFSVYEAVKFENLVIEKKALDKIFERLV